MEDLNRAFVAYCQFGASKSNPSDALTMDGARFAKFCKDTGVIGGPITNTDVDIVFSKVKAKNARRINQQEFILGIQQLGEKKFKGTPEDSLNNIISQILKSGGVPKLAEGATQVEKSTIVEKLTDTSKYTGTHKERFDGNGKGKGLDGRTDLGSQTLSLSQITNRKEADVRGVAK